MLGRPYELRVDLDGTPQAWLDSFWASGRSAGKRAFMETMLCEADSDYRMAA
jgi:hypothetical protein